MMKLIAHSVYKDIVSVQLIRISCHSSKLKCAASPRTWKDKLVRVKSSNIWSYGIDIPEKSDNTGTVMVQFMSENGGPGDVYLYYDVPVRLYRSWQSAPSKGHFFWKHIRDRYYYRKLTGDKKGKLRNALN